MHLFEHKYNVIIEIYFEDESIRENIDLLFKLFANGYNLLEPEHSQKYPMLGIDILIP